jgi:hypothetical protein
MTMEHRMPLAVSLVALPWIGCVRDERLGDLPAGGADTVHPSSDSDQASTEVGTTVASEASTSDVDEHPDDTSDATDSTAELPCDDGRERFAEETMWPVLYPRCFACHNPEGAAADTEMLIFGEDFPGYVNLSYLVFADLARRDVDGTPLILAKATRAVEHEGGMRIADGDPSYLALEAMIHRIRACD